MSSLRFTSFGAAIVPLSKIVVDRTLDMGDYPLIGQRIMAPYRPYTWQTESFPYDDRSPTVVMEGISKGVYSSEQLVTTWTCDTPNPCYVRALIPIRDGASYSYAQSARIAINGNTVYTTGSWAKGTTKTTDAIIILPGEVFELYVSGSGGNPTYIENASLVNTGHQAPVNLDLEGRFLALEQDFGDLTATLTFGNEADVPFSDYPNRFPYAPDKITVSRHKLEDRPVINVYKGV